MRDGRQDLGTTPRRPLSPPRAPASGLTGASLATCARGRKTTGTRRTVRWPAAVPILCRIEAPARRRSCAPSVSGWPSPRSRTGTRSLLRAERGWPVAQRVSFSGCMDRLRVRACSVVRGDGQGDCQNPVERCVTCQSAAGTLCTHARTRRCGLRRHTGHRRRPKEFAIARKSVSGCTRVGSGPCMQCGPRRLTVRLSKPGRTLRNLSICRGHAVHARTPAEMRPKVQVAVDGGRSSRSRAG